MAKYFKGIVLFGVLGLSIISCNNKNNNSGNVSTGDSSRVVKQLNKDSVILALTTHVLTLIKNKEYSELANIFHPENGARFSPYSYVDTTRNVMLSKADFIKKLNSDANIYWGDYDGRGDSILLSIREYFSKFVYNKDFLNADKTSLNKIIGKGNSLNNLPTVYKDCEFTESYFPGFDKKLEGMDWCSLRLVYKKYGDNYYLVGIIHDQWTI